MKIFMSMMGAGASAAALCGNMGTQSAHALQMNGRNHYTQKAADQVFRQSLRTDQPLVRETPIADYASATGQGVNRKIQAMAQQLLQDDLKAGMVFRNGVPVGCNDTLKSTCPSTVTRRSLLTDRTSGGRGSSSVLRAAATQSLKPRPGTQQRNNSSQVKQIIGQ